MNQFQTNITNLRLNKALLMAFASHVSSLSQLKFFI